MMGQIVLVTGAAGGIGQACCQALAAAGATVVATDIGPARDSDVASLWLTHDVTSPEAWQNVLRQIADRYGHLDALVNNAGISLIERLEKTSIEQWRRVFQINVESVVLGMQASLPLLRASGATRAGGASVVNISSVAALRGVAFNAAYSASKAAVTLLTKSAAKEYATLGYPVRVNSVHPSAIDTPMMDGILTRYVEEGFARTKEEQRAMWTTMSPLKRLGRAEEIAGGVVYLCSSAASFVTGSELVIDGAVTA